MFFLSGCCHEHHLVPPDPQSSARRNSPSDGAPSVRRVHSICLIYRLGTTLTQYDLKFWLRRHSSYLLMFLDWNSSQWKLCSLEVPHNANCTCMRRVLKSKLRIASVEYAWRQWTLRSINWLPLDILPTFCVWLMNSLTDHLVGAEYFLGSR